MTIPTLTYPDHHEGIAGRQLDPDGLLSLDERALPCRLTLMAVAQHLRRACMVGQPAPIVARMEDRTRAVQLGDLVVEVTVGLSPRTDRDRRVKAFGYLVAHRDEWSDSEADWKAFAQEDPEWAFPDNRATDHAWYIQYGPDPADVCRWTNCQLMMVPVDLDMFD